MAPSDRLDKGGSLRTDRVLSTNQGLICIVSDVGVPIQGFAESLQQSLKTEDRSIFGRSSRVVGI